MSGGAFGRKGLAPSGGAMPTRPVFGAVERPAAPERLMSGGDADLAARREAFLAEERARPKDAGRPHGASANIREKSVTRAYLLWFFLGGFAVHRFYLGYPVSGAIQAGLAPIGYALLISGSLAGFVPLFFGGLWILADMFIIPSLQREANEKIRSRATALVFA